MSIDGWPVNRYRDVKLALWDKPPGAVVILKVQRSAGHGYITVPITLPWRYVAIGLCCHKTMLTVRRGNGGDQR
ncbi:MAG: hypothetical protein GKR94_08855 [Gammaproteobacteria bacterium]|nr:hypothetical protein [Gammaproteobacteria bacterium]